VIFWKKLKKDKITQIKLDTKRVKEKINKLKEKEKEKEKEGYLITNILLKIKKLKNEIEEFANNEKNSIWYINDTIEEEINSKKLQKVIGEEKAKREMVEKHYRKSIINFSEKTLKKKIEHFNLDTENASWKDVFNAEAEESRKRVALSVGLPRTASWDEIDKKRGKRSWERFHY